MTESSRAATNGLVGVSVLLTAVSNISINFQSQVLVDYSAVISTSDTLQL